MGHLDYCRACPSGFSARRRISFGRVRNRGCPAVDTHVRTCSPTGDGRARKEAQRHVSGHRRTGRRVGIRAGHKGRRRCRKRSHRCRDRHRRRGGRHGGDGLGDRSVSEPFRPRGLDLGHYEGRTEKAKPLGSACRNRRWLHAGAHESGQPWLSRRASDHLTMLARLSLALARARAVALVA
jgi:hypothetical protein